MRLRAALDSEKNNNALVIDSKLIQEQERSEELSALSVERGVQLRILQQKVMQLELLLEKERERQSNLAANAPEVRMAAALKLENERLSLRVIALEKCQNIGSSDSPPRTIPQGSKHSSRAPSKTSTPTSSPFLPRQRVPMTVDFSGQKLARTSGDRPPPDVQSVFPDTTPSLVPDTAYPYQPRPNEPAVRRLLRIA